MQVTYTSLQLVKWTEPVGAHEWQHLVCCSGLHPGKTAAPQRLLCGFEEGVERKAWIYNLQEGFLCLRKTQRLVPSSPWQTWIKKMDILVMTSTAKSGGWENATSGI